MSTSLDIITLEKEKQTKPKKHKQITEGSLVGPGRVSTGQVSFLVPGQMSHFWSRFVLLFVRFSLFVEKQYEQRSKEKATKSATFYPTPENMKKRPKVHQKVDPPPKVRQKVRQNVDPSKKCARKPS